MQRRWFAVEWLVKCINSLLMQLILYKLGLGHFLCRYPTLTSISKSLAFRYTDTSLGIHFSLCLRMIMSIMKFETQWFHLQNKSIWDCCLKIQSIDFQVCMRYRSSYLWSFHFKHCLIHQLLQWHCQYWFLSWKWLILSEEKCKPNLYLYQKLYHSICLQLL